jgi:hypothetical protein
MEEVEPSKLIPGEYYYLQSKRESDKLWRTKGQFHRIFENEPQYGGTQAVFTIVGSEKIKSKKMEGYLDNAGARGFPISSYKFYKPLPEGFIDRYEQKVKEDRLTAFEKMLNQQKLPMRRMQPMGPIGPLPDKISVSSMFTETPEEKKSPEYIDLSFIEGDKTFYGSDPDKSNIGTQLKNTYGAYLGGRHRKSRKFRKSRKTKSRKTKSRRRR